MKTHRHIVVLLQVQGEGKPEAAVVVSGQFRHHHVSYRTISGYSISLATGYIHAG